MADPIIPLSLSMSIASSLQTDFVRFSIEQGVLRFGSFTTKSGRNSPYFFNAGLFNRGGSIARLAGFYADTLLASGVAFDMLFGPAYKGIPLVTATAIALSTRGVDVPFAFNRKEAKDHGEGGTLIGAPLKGRVVIVDDVITAGTSVRESVALIEAAGATPAGVIIALDRMERGGDAVNLTDSSAVQEVEKTYGVPVISIASLNDVLAYAQHADAGELAQHVDAISAYRARYGVH